LCGELRRKVDGDGESRSVCGKEELITDQAVIQAYLQVKELGGSGRDLAVALAAAEGLVGSSREPRGGRLMSAEEEDLLQQERRQKRRNQERLRRHNKRNGEGGEARVEVRGCRRMHKGEGGEARVEVRGCRDRHNGEGGDAWVEVLGSRDRRNREGREARVEVRGCRRRHKGEGGEARVEYAGKCGACGQMGHMRTSKLCPYHNPSASDAAEPSATKMKIKLGKTKTAPPPLPAAAPMGEGGAVETGDATGECKVILKRIRPSGPQLSRADRQKRRNTKEDGSVELDAMGTPVVGSSKKMRRAESRSVELNNIFTAVINSLNDELSPYVVVKGGKPDKQWRIFMTPVPIKDIVKDYMDFVQTPMSGQVMKTKAKKIKYNSLDEFMADFELIRDNAYSYNAGGGKFGDPALCQVADAFLERARELVRERDPEIKIAEAKTRDAQVEPPPPEDNAKEPEPEMADTGALGEDRDPMEFKDDVDQMTP
ncbi:hypothetical protein CYMTET_51124, partial [Cymbomonas tetramitiformis]